MSGDGDAIDAVVKADPTLEGLIAGRIFPFVLPPKPVMPAVTRQLVSQPSSNSQERARWSWPRWRFRIVAEDYGQIDAIEAALSAIFNDPGRTPFANSWTETASESREPQTGRFWRLLDVVGFKTAGA